MHTQKHMRARTHTHMHAHTHQWFVCWLNQRLWFLPWRI